METKASAMKRDNDNSDPSSLTSSSVPLPEDATAATLSSTLDKIDETDDEKEKSGGGGGGGGGGKSYDECGKPAPIGKLLSLATPEMRLLILALFLMIASEATSLCNPLLVARAYDDLVNPELSSSERMSSINRTMLTVLVVHGTGVVLFFLRSILMGVAGERVVARTRHRLYRAIWQQEIAFFDVTKTGELVSRLGSDTALLQQGTSQALPEVAVGLIKVLVSIGIMFWISPKLAGLMLACVFVILLICFPFGQLVSNLSKTYQDVLGQAQTCSTEALGAVRTVQSFGAEDREQDRYRRVIGAPEQYYWWWPVDYKTHRTTYSVGFFKAITMVSLFTIIFGLGFAGMYFCLWYGFKLVNDGDITLGQLTAFQSYIFQIGGALAGTSQFIAKLIEAQGAAARLFFLLERVPAIPTPPPVDFSKTTTTGEQPDHDDDDESPTPLKQPATIEGAVDFNRVCFSYPSRPHVDVLRNFSLSIPANQTAALVGTSGAGKSTVVALLQRFYDVTGGSVTIDGNDIRDLDLKWLRSHIAYVQQEPQLFGLTVRENIAYGMDREVAQEEIEAVAREANAHDFISQWPDGYETLVGERGIQLSGGQKQRIAIARALLKNPKVLLLDEATSALDSESEHLVQEAIDKAVVGRTTIIVAHRLSTIQRAEQIVVVDDHQIVDVGSHAELLGRCSKYQDLIKRQSLVGSLPPNMIKSIEESTLEM